MDEGVLQSIHSTMSDNGLLLEWPELKRVIAEGRCELNLTAAASGDRNPSINDERLQSEIFATVSFTIRKRDVFVPLIIELIL